MNRNLFQAASAALLCFALAAGLSGCGGGGGSDSQSSSAPSTGTGAGGTGSSTSTGSGTIGGKTTVGGSSGTPPVFTWVNPNPIPNCTSKIVYIAIQGDTIATDEFNTGRLQALMDSQFGPGSTSVLNYALGGNTSDSYLYITGDVIVASYGVWDMLDGVSVDHYLHNMQAMAPTLVVTQTPVITEFDHDPTPYINAVKGMNVPVADAFSYVSGLVTSVNPLSAMLTDGMHPTADMDAKIVENVIAPEVAKQVAPMRCVQL